LIGVLLTESAIKWGEERRRRGAMSDERENEKERSGREA
jgi:hypothetical protein